MIRVLIADDHAVVRDGLKLLVDRRDDLRVVGLAADGAEAVRLFESLRPDITLMDLRMPRLSGVQALEAIRRNAPEARVIVLTTYDTDDEIFHALRAGARAYLLKDVPTETLIDTIRAVHTGARRVPPELVERLADHVPAAELQARELQILTLLVEGRSNREIGSELDLTESTVKWYLTAIFEKLGVRDRTQAATAGLRRGLVRRDS